ncbi:hypothetical protein Aasi_0462 [Candidatus Amoebophilus asiaticus 5a2]|uniref:Uncharacterized protein n=1 Tax=Amoebophilus asiaticus (strain 5a2) TaxID=452471 RepID=B3ERL4_AMOA5|nr:hypothetical protein Aasi_0456 [Candidatus Amoebophilus asiaticus 5a2]ACE05872.1 hypothetical protein Aasi_0462 [Candidatus Amoebophilus asiaticus 5a2]
MKINKIHVKRFYATFIYHLHIPVSINFIKLISYKAIILESIKRIDIKEASIGGLEINHKSSVI